jgi:hypothetical protein
MKDIDLPLDESEEQRIIRITSLAHRRLPPSSNTPMSDIPPHKREKVSIKRALRDLILSARDAIREVKRIKKQNQRERRNPSTKEP